MTGRVEFDYGAGEPERWSKSSEECPEPRLWRADDGYATETEVLALLFALTAALKPRVAVESGTWHGAGARAIAAGLRVAGRGHLWTVERDATVAARARAALADDGYADLVTVADGDDVAAVAGRAIAAAGGLVDLYYCDSDDLFNGARGWEIRRMLPLMAPAGIIVAHDVSPVMYAAHRADVLQLEEEGLVSVVMLPTPRGLAIMRRRPC